MFFGAASEFKNVIRANKADLRPQYFSNERSKEVPLFQFFIICACINIFFFFFVVVVFFLFFFCLSLFSSSLLLLVPLKGCAS